MHLLDRLFQRFDTLATAHGVYKARADACSDAACAARDSPPSCLLLRRLRQLAIRTSA